MWACDRFGSLSDVCRDFLVSSDFVYRAFYEQLELRRRMNNQYEWPTAIGIDEHGFGRDFSRKTGGTAFVTMVVNHNKRKLMEVVFGKKTEDLIFRLAHIPGRENVRYVTLDMSDGYRSFAKNFFPNAQLIADKFHVIRLLSPVILKERKKIVGTNANRKARALLLCSSKNLDFEDRIAIRQYLDRFPRLKELWTFKERLHGFYRCKGYDRAKAALEHITFDAALSNEPEIRKLGKTLQYWSTEVLNYFAYRYTNARVEGFNNKAALVRRRAFGYRNPANYRLRLLSACS
jgi:transposase